MAGDHPKYWRALTRRPAGRRVLFNSALADKPSQPHPFVLVLFFLVARVFGYEDALEAVMTGVQNEPFLTGAHPTSHRVLPGRRFDFIKQERRVPSPSSSAPAEMSSALQEVHQSPSMYLKCQTHARRWSIRAGLRISQSCWRRPLTCLSDGSTQLSGRFSGFSDNSEFSQQIRSLCPFFSPPTVVTVSSQCGGRIASDVTAHPRGMSSCARPSRQPWLQTCT